MPKFTFFVGALSNSQVYEKKRMSRRKNNEIQRAILKVLEKRGWMTPGAIAREIETTLRTTKRHLYKLQRFKRRIEVLYYYPNGRLYRCKKR